jgi:ComF family protein
MTGKTALQSLLHLFFPHLCAGCDSDIINNQQVLCLKCIEQLPVTDFHLHANNPVEKIFLGRLPLAHAGSYLFFTKDSLLQHLLHQLKYKGNKDLGSYFGKQIGNALLQSNRFTDIEALIPLPLFASRERKRGYNQATVLCEGIASVLQVPVLKNVIKRTMATETQTKKNRIERWQNIKDKFELTDSAAIQHKHVLLVDDVVTTGATLEACGRELLSAGTVQLSIFTMAYTLK